MSEIPPAAQDLPAFSFMLEVLDAPPNLLLRVRGSSGIRGLPESYLRNAFCEHEDELESNHMLRNCHMLKQFFLKHSGKLTVHQIN